MFLPAGLRIALLGHNTACHHGFDVPNSDAAAALRGTGNGNLETTPCIGRKVSIRRAMTSQHQDTHERLTRGETITPGSERAFGFVMAAVFALVSLISWWYAGYWWPWTAPIAAAFCAFALLYPRALKSLNRAWFRLGLMLHAVVNPIIMGLIFFFAVTPTALVMRLRRKDLLRLKRDPESPTYWIERRPPGPAPETLKDQF